MQPVIREAQASDIKAISHLLTAGAELHHQALPLLHSPPDLAATEQFITHIVQDEQTHVLVGELDGHVAGFVQFRVMTSGPPMVIRSYVSVSSLVVQEAYRRQGLGQALMQHVHQWAEKHGLAEVDLNVYEFNTQAIEFYEKLGYQTISRRMKRNL